MTSWRVLATLIFMLVLGGRSMAQTCTIAKLAELPITMVSAQPTVEAKISGQDVRLLLDTGAFHSMLSQDVANRLKLRTLGYIRISGIGGDQAAGVAYAQSFELAGARRGSTQFIIGHSADGLDGLLGEDILAPFDIEYDLANGVVRFFHTTGCQGATLAYWAGEKPVAVASMDRTGDKHIFSTARINDRALQVLFDTGASTSFLRTRSARRLGVATSGEGVTVENSTRGVGSAIVPTSAAPVDSFEVGGERVLHTRVRLGDGNVTDADMLLGADFFLSHRIFVSRSTKQVVFTYNGGPVFDLPPVELATTKAGAEAPPGGAAAQAATSAVEDPVDADGWSRRGVAREARGDSNGALADLSRAVALAPKEARYRRQRATLYAKARLPNSALADIDAAIALKPANTDLQIERVKLRIEVGDMAGAQAALVAVAPLLKSDNEQLKLAALYARTKLFDTSIALLDKSIAASHPSLYIGYALGERCWTRALANRELDTALADCNRALRMTDRAPMVLEGRGLVHIRRADFAEAIRDYDEALQKEAKDDWSLYGRSIAESHIGAAAAAKTDRAVLAAVDPDFPTQAERYGVEP